MKTYMVIYFGSAFLTLFLTPVISRIAKARGLVDAPGPRKVHKRPVPRVGGIIFVVSVLSLTIPVLFLNNVIGSAFRKVQPQLSVLLAAGVSMFIVGLIDDIRSVPARIKLLFLMGASLAVSLSGARIETIEVGNWFTIDLGWVAWPVTLAWITGITVGMNLIDGLDGLAAGVALIVCATIAVFAYISGMIAMFVLLLALLGSLTGFLFFNFNPAKIFMGDGGSMFIGFMIGAGSVVCQAKSATLVGIALPALALGVPILDTLLTVVRRTVLDRRSVFSGDGGHIHHHLLAMGLRQRTVVIIIYGVTLLSAGMGTLMLVLRQGAQIAILIGGILILFVVFSLSRSIRLRETLTAIKQRFHSARYMKYEQNCFDEAQIRIREADTFNKWWKSLCFMAEKMNFECMVLSWSNGDKPTDKVVWQRTFEQPSYSDMFCLSMPISNGNPGIRMQISVFSKINAPLECIGRRAILLGRLLGENNVPLEPALHKQYEHETATRSSNKSRREFSTNITPPLPHYQTRSLFPEEYVNESSSSVNLDDGNRRNA